MDKKAMLAALKRRENGYLAAHPRSGETDIWIAKAYFSGKSAVQIAMELPCGEFTAYRAVARVKEYLASGNQYVKIVKDYLSNHEPNYGDGEIHSLLGMLWQTYTEINPIDNDNVRELFTKLEKSSGKLQENASKELFRLVCGLCQEYEQQAFLEGLHVGTRLMVEMMEG